MRLTVELEPLQDAIDELNLVLAALALSHGPRVRALETRIIRLEIAPGRPQVFPVEDGLIVCPPAEWTEILKEARRLSVIP